MALLDCAPCVWQAIVASEDKRFFSHPGVDLWGLSRALATMGKQVTVVKHFLPTNPL